MTLGRKIFLKQNTKSMNHKNFDKLDHIKIKIFIKNYHKESKKRSQKVGRRYLQHITNKGEHAEYTKNPKESNRKRQATNKKQAKEMNWHLIEN